MSDTTADAKTARSSKNKGKASNKKRAAPAEEGDDAFAEPATKKMTNGDGSASATASAAPVKYRLSAQPKIQLNKWGLPKFELYATLCQGGDSRGHEMSIMTPPALVRRAELHGLGAKGYQQEKDTDKNMLKVELVFGDLPVMVLERHPHLEAEHQHFIQYVKDVIENTKDLLKEDSNVRPGVYKRIKADCKAEGYSGEGLVAEARERYFHDLELEFTLFQKNGKQMMAIPLMCKAMEVNKEDANPRRFQPPGPDVKEPLYTYLSLVGPYAEFKANRVRYYNLKSEELFYNELRNDPYMQVLNKGDIAAVRFSMRTYSDKPTGSEPGKWKIKGHFDHSMVKLFPAEETEELQHQFKEQADRILDTFDNPPPEVDEEYADGW